MGLTTRPLAFHGLHNGRKRNAEQQSFLQPSLKVTNQHFCNIFMVTQGTPSCVDFRGTPCTCLVQLITARKDLGILLTLKSIKIIFCKAHEYFHELLFVLT